MSGYSFFQRASRAFNDYPHLPKLLVLFTVRYCQLLLFVFFLILVFACLI